MKLVRCVFLGVCVFFCAEQLYPGNWAAASLARLLACSYFFKGVCSSSVALSDLLYLGLLPIYQCRLGIVRMLECRQIICQFRLDDLMPFWNPIPFS